MPKSVRYNASRIISLLLFVAFVCANLLIVIQVYAFTHFRSDKAGLAKVSVQNTSWLDWLAYLFTGIPIARPSNTETPAQHNLPYETRTIPLNQAEWLEAWYIPHDQARGVIIGFSGYLGDKDNLLAPAAWMHQFGYSVLLVDVRGSGGSSGNNTTLGMREADDVVAAFHYAQNSLPEQNIILYGISMGGSSIMRALAVEQIKPQAMIIEAVFDRLDTTVRHRFDHVGIPSWPATEVLLFWGSVVVGHNGFTHNPHEYAAKIDTPSLILNGAHDPWVHTSEAEAIYQALQGPKQLYLVPQAQTGHEPPLLLANESAWVEQVQLFLDRLETSKRNS